MVKVKLATPKPVNVTLRTPRVLMRRLAKLAAAEGVSLNTWIIRCLAARAGMERPHDDGSH